MRIIIDGDKCSVKDETAMLAMKHGVKCIVVCDENHRTRVYGASVIVVACGPNSADYEIFRLLLRGDIVITEDVGLAAMSIAKGAIAMNSSGNLFRPEAVDTMLNRVALHRLHYEMGLVHKGYHGSNRLKKDKLKQVKKERFIARLDYVVLNELLRLEREEKEAEERRQVELRRLEAEKREAEERRQAELRRLEAEKREAEERRQAERRRLEMEIREAKNRRRTEALRSQLQRQAEPECYANTNPVEQFLLGEEKRVAELYRLSRRHPR